MLGPGDSGISADYLKEDIKLLKIPITLQKSEREVGLAEAARRASYAEEVYGLTTFWCWRVLAMHDALRLLREEHELQADVMRKMDKEWFCSRLRERREREKEGKNVSPQQQLRGPTKLNMSRS